MGKYKKSLMFHKKYVANKDSIFNKEKLQLIENLRFEFQLGEKNRKIELLNKEKEVQTLKLNKQSIVSKFFIISSIVFLLVAAIVIWLHILNVRKNKILRLVNKQIQEKNERISITTNKLEVANEELEKTLLQKTECLALLPMTCGVRFKFTRLKQSLAC
jgi:hypothetical protein